MPKVMSDFGGSSPTGFGAITNPSSNYPYSQIPEMLNPTPISQGFSFLNSSQPAPASDPTPAPYTQAYTPDASSPTPYYTGSTATPATNFVQTPGGGASAGPSTPPTPPPPPKPTEGDAANDPTFQTQAAAYKHKLADFINGITGQVGDGNLITKDGLQGGPGSLNFIDTLRGLNRGDLYKESHDNNGLLHYESAGALGGSMGTGYNTAVSNFDQSRSQGLQNLAEDYTARGLGNSGVFGGARTLADNNYTNQLNSLTDSTLGQYNSLGNDLRSNQDSIESQIVGARNDALGRLNALYTAGLPTTA